MDEPADTERWHRADGLFAEALELPADERLQFVQKRCAGDSELLRELEELLRAQAGARAFLDGSGGSVVAGALAEALTAADADDGIQDRSGTRLGPYRVIAPIDRGGMADVYLGERADGAFEQRVAIKIQRRGLDTDDLLARFRAERQILSQLDHPNIARLLDGGATDDGRPYLVMEYVEGLPITRYCEEHGLSVPERLRLFIQVARAVQAAHAQLVVHRDIKPSNVLVTAAGEVKLLDFGIAKLLDPTAWPDDVPLTRTGFHPLTPQYASPEQVRGDPITTASDIYQLGLLLFRLLTGGRPFDIEDSGRRALEEAITGTRPARPSSFVETNESLAGGGIERRQLARRLRGDLDTIVLAALRKEPDRRYASAHEMAEDVRRHLEGRPIAARQESRLYRVGKFVRRNPWAAPTAAGVVLALGVYISTLIRHGEQLEAERNTVRLEAENARTSQDFLVGLFRSADPFAVVPDSRRDIRVREVMDEGARRARSELADRPEMQALLLGTIGDVFLGLGDPERAVELRREALGVAQATFGPESPETMEALRELAEPTMQLERRTGGVADSAPSIALRALDLARTHFGVSHPEALRAQITLAHMLFYSHGLDAADPLLDHAITQLRKHADVERELLAEALMVRARVLAGSSGRWPEAEAPAREAVELLADELGGGHARVLAARLWLGSVMQDENEAIDLMKGAGVALDSLLGTDHEMAIRTRRVTGLKLRRAGRYAEAALAFDDAADRRAQRDGVQGFWYEVERRMHADMALLAGIPDEAVSAYDELIALGSNEESKYRISRAWALVGLGRAQEALRDIRGVQGEFPDLSSAQRAGAGCVSGRALRSLGRASEAHAAIEDAAALLRAENYEPRPGHPCAGILTRVTDPGS
ncbi:MAG: protein kinase domain-containing protein [Gemmatimonadota bacterium]